jgi:hypothetical protein
VKNYKKDVMTSTLPRGNLGSVGSLLAASIYQGNPDRNHKLGVISLLFKFAHSTPLITAN